MDDTNDRVKQRKITDLLDCIEDDSVQLRPQTAYSAERIKEITMEKIGIYAKRANYVGQAPRGSGGAWAGRRKTARFGSLRRLGTIAVAVALALALLTGAAFANVLGIGDYFKSIFGEMDEEQLAVLEEIGTADMAKMPAAVSNGTTITPLAAIGDEDWYYLALKIEAPEGTVLDQGDNFFQVWNPDEPFNTDMLPYGETKWIDDVPGDNVVEAVFMFGKQYGSAANPNDGWSKIFRINGLWLQSPGKVYTKVLDGVWEFDLSINSGGKYQELPAAKGLTTLCETDGPIMSKSGETLPRAEAEITLRHMAVSPLGLRYEYTYENVDIDFWVPGAITEVVLKNGGTVAVNNADGEYDERGAKTHAYFDAPVNVSEIDHIRFGDISVPMP